jgi:hypothetical protein
MDTVAPLRPGDRIVACSDGLYRGLSPEELADIARRGDPMTAAEQLKNAVLRKRLPHQDNLTVILFEVTSTYSLIETAGERLIKLIEIARPTIRDAVYGAVGVMLGILVTLGALALSSPHRHPTTTQATTTPPTQTSSGNPAPKKETPTEAAPPNPPPPEQQPAPESPGSSQPSQQSLGPNEKPPEEMPTTVPPAKKPTVTQQSKGH